MKTEIILTERVLRMIASNPPPMPASLYQVSRLSGQDQDGWNAKVSLKISEWVEGLRAQDATCHKIESTQDKASMIVGCLSPLQCGLILDDLQIPNDGVLRNARKSLLEWADEDAKPTQQVSPDSPEEGLPPVVP